MEKSGMQGGFWNFIGILGLGDEMGGWWVYWVVGCLYCCYKICVQPIEGCWGRLLSHGRLSKGRLAWLLVHKASRLLRLL
jgi:hypothetical protein